MNISERINKLAEAFSKDGFRFDRNDIKIYNDRLGVRASHSKEKRRDTGGPKRAFYVEGSHYEMGYLLGFLAQDDVSTMANEFVDKVVFAFIDENTVDNPEMAELGKMLRDFIYAISHAMQPEIPEELANEMKGMLKGCQDAKSDSTVSWEKLVVLNYGIDILTSIIYSGDLLKFAMHGVEEGKLASKFKVPLMCNAFAVFGKAPKDGALFGRDFMFATAGVFQNTACMIIYNPFNPGPPEPQWLPMVSVTAPGIVGSIAAMNKNGVAVGVNMVPSGNCDPHKVGVNSLLLGRNIIGLGKSADDAVVITNGLKRGVSWLYVVADGESNKAYIIECGASDDTEISDLLEYANPLLKENGLLPDEEYIKKRATVKLQNGLMARSDSYVYPSDYINDFNEKLWNYSKNSIGLTGIELRKDAFEEKGYICRYLSGEYKKNFPIEQNCPLAYYFAPQREAREGVLVTSNLFIIPEMRLTAMKPWTTLIVGERRYNDIQWRYDQLNKMVLDEIDKSGQISREKAWDLINFLSPRSDLKADFQDYYGRDSKGNIIDFHEIKVEGSISLFDLKAKTVESLYGYYEDNSITISLMNYV